MTQQRLQNYDEVIDKKRETILDKMVTHDSSKTTPIDRHPFFIEFVKYCVCKIYGITGSVDDNKHAYSVFVYLYWKTTQLSYPEMVKKIGGEKSQHSRTIQKISGCKDQKDLAIIAYLEKKSLEFYKLM